MQKILGLIESGKQDGAECLAGGCREGDKGFFVQPTVFAGVTEDMKIGREEVSSQTLEIVSQYLSFLYVAVQIVNTCTPNSASVIT